MKNSNSAKLLVLKDPQGQSVRLIQTQQDVLHLVQNRETKRIELLDSNVDYKESHRLLQEVRLDQKKESIALKNVGTLTFLQAQDYTRLDPKPLRNEETDFPHIVRWTSGVNGAVLGFLILMAFIITPKTTPPTDKKDTVVTIDLDKLSPPDMVATKPPQEPKQKVAATPIKKKKMVHVVPRTNKKKPLLVTKTSTSRKIPRSKLANQNAPQNFQRLGSLGAISNALKGSRQGMGSGLRNGSGGTGGFGRGAGMGRGNGTMGHGHDSGGGYEQALYGKGVIAAQVGGGGGGFGSGWGEGTRGSGGYGTKGKGGGHAGYGTSKVGSSGVSRFTYPVRDEAVIEGGLDREAVDLVVMKNLGQIIYCYELGLQQKSGLRGRVSMDFTINGHGRVSRVSVGNSSLRSSQVENCMITKIKNWKFPQPEGGVNVDVNYPFALQRVSQN
jgi:TonB family protein